MSHSGRLTHRQLAQRANHVPDGYIDAIGELTDAGEAWAEDLRDFNEADSDAEMFWRQETTRYYAPGPSNADSGAIG